MKEDKNYIRFRTIIEVLGKPKEHVEKTIKEYVEKIKSDSDLMVLKEYYAKLKEQEDMWSVFTELEIVVKNVQNLTGFCFDFMPSSIEIIKPEELSFKNTILTNVMNDLQAKLHNIDMVAKKLKNENDFLKRNLNTSLQNVITVLLAVKNSCDKEKLAKLSGIDQKEIDLLLENLLKEGKIKKEDNLYSLK
ncbi:MAG: hypothetical protein ABIC04_02920 [Nanoarchaeota archaeon]